MSLISLEICIGPEHVPGRWFEVSPSIMSGPETLLLLYSGNTKPYASLRFPSVCLRHDFVVVSAYAPYAGLAAAAATARADSLWT